MKRLAIFGVLAMLVSGFFTGCTTTVPRDNNAATTSTSSTSTYSK